MPDTGRPTPGHALSVPMPLTASLDGPPGAPVLVLGNSLGTSCAVWKRQLPALRAHFRLLRFELPGHGGSAAPAGPYTLGDLGAGVLALLDQHDIRQAGYCGISLGGMIGMWLAANHPDRIGSLGLVCTSAYLPPASGWLARADQVQVSGLASISTASIGRWFTPAFVNREPAVAAAFAAELERTDPVGYSGCCAAIAGMDLRSSLRSVTAPTIVISGAEDPATPPAHGAAIASAIRGARLAVIRGAAHLANVSSPGEVTAVLLGQPRTVSGRPR
ncbi:MAG TPA: 3-oxoadipate enol-lactonase [Streptosporangiaceae bacterium]|nr:3-oxoadipate enol-lactonase [Streptosporangiaceae bacterium]